MVFWKIVKMAYMTASYTAKIISIPRVNKIDQYSNFLLKIVTKSKYCDIINIAYILDERIDLNNVQKKHIVTTFQ